MTPAITVCIKRRRSLQHDYDVQSRIVADLADKAMNGNRSDQPKEDLIKALAARQKIETSIRIVEQEIVSLVDALVT